MTHYPNIKNLRLIRDYKQEYVANYLGMSQPEYSRLETGMRSVRAEDIHKLSQLYSVRPDQLLQIDNAKEFSTNSNKASRRGDAVPRDIVDKLVENNTTLLKSVMEYQAKTERIIDKLIDFLDRRPGSETLCTDLPLNSRVNDQPS
jgi:transcriptional regulator with XRE-family HTH domain